MIKEKKKKYDCKNFVLTLFCLFLLFFSPMISNFSAFANETIYTTVLEDLSRDENFNAENYPVLTDDYSLDVIQIAESIDKKLFVYVYSPSTLQATSINISKTIGEDIAPNNYTLTLLSQENSLHKYLVNNFKIENTLEHNYTIVSIFRVWNKDIDPAPDEGQTISELSYPVGQEYLFKYTDKGLVVSSSDVEIITIENKYVGFVRYDTNNAPDWLTPRDSYIDRHFVAFSTDKKVDDLLSVSLAYSSQSVHYVKGEENNATFGNIYSNIPVDISCEDKVEYSSDITGVNAWLFGRNEYDWYQIEKTSSFITENTDLSNFHTNYIFNTVTTSTLTEQGKKDLQGTDWVLSFLVTEYEAIKKSENLPGIGSNLYQWTEIDYTIVSDVTILRLEFSRMGEIYNLGVIDNKQSGDGIPDNITKTDYDLSIIVKLIIIILCIIFCCIVLGPFLPTFFSFLWKCIKLLFKGIYYVLKYIAIGVYYIIASPFLLIKNL